MDDLKKFRVSNPFMDYNHAKAVYSDGVTGIVELTIRPESLNVHGQVHGGLVMAMSDFAAGLLAITDGRTYVTQSIHMNFIGNVAEGTIQAKSTMVKRGRTISIVRVAVTTPDGRLLADATLNMFCVGGPEKKD